MAKKKISKCNNCSPMDESAKMEIEALYNRGWDLNRISASINIPVTQVKEYLDFINTPKPIEDVIV
jgi:hypothetical protein